MVKLFDSDIHDQGRQSSNCLMTPLANGSRGIVYSLKRTVLVRFCYAYGNGGEV